MTNLTLITHKNTHSHTHLYIEATYPDFSCSCCFVILNVHSKMYPVLVVATSVLEDLVAETLPMALSTHESVVTLPPPHSPVAMGTTSSTFTRSYTSTSPEKI